MASVQHSSIESHHNDGKPPARLTPQNAFADTSNHFRAKFSSWKGHEQTTWGKGNAHLQRLLLYNPSVVNAFMLYLTLALEPEFSEPIPNVTVAVGRDATLPCVVEHLGTHKVAWIHIDKQMILTIHHHVITRNPRFRVTHNNHKNWMLHINNVQEEDRGYYMCQINTVPMKSQVGYLEVVVPPDILDDESSHSTMVVKEGLNVSLVCRASGYPAPKITWRREDNQAISLGRRQGQQQESVAIVEGEELNISKVSRLHMGAYLCIASNGVPPSVSKRITLEVEFSPMIWIPNQLVGAPIGKEVTLECHTEAHPKSINYWTRGQGVIISNDKYETLEIDSAYKVHMKLKIRRLEPKDFGSYKCSATNSLGGTEGAIRLYEIHPPTLSPRITEVKITNKFEDLSVRNETSAIRNKNVGSQQNALLDKDNDLDKGKKYKHKDRGSGSESDSTVVTPPKHRPQADTANRSPGTWRQSINQLVLSLGMIIVSLLCP